MLFIAKWRLRKLERSQGHSLVCMILASVHKVNVDNHQLSVTPASNYCNIELFDVQPRESGHT